MVLEQNMELMVFLPGVHPTVDDRIVHGVGHRKPVDGEVYLLDVLSVGDLWHE
jgi:hypothetical protein